jgi:hypothetical protein
MDRLNRDDRRQPAARGALLATLGVVFLRVLVADWGDNAYLWPALAGMGLVVAALPFALATLLPARARRAATWLGTTLVWLLLAASAVFVLPYLVATLVTSASDAPRDRAFLTHLLGLAAMAAMALWVRKPDAH